MIVDREKLAEFTPIALAVLRIISGFLLFQHGMSKYFGVPHVAMFDNLQVFSLLGIAGVLELVGGALLMVGLWTRPVAFVLCGEMAIAYFIGHGPQGYFLSPLMNQGEPAVLFCFIFLYLSVAGAGAWSMDNRRRH